jgi:hypothetical protein
MFSVAYKVVQQFVRPVIVSTRLANGKVNCGLATFIVVNAEGWIVTAAHVLNAYSASQQHANEKSAYDAAVAKVRADNSLSTKQRNRKLENIKPNPDWITNHSFWWGQNGAAPRQFKVDLQADIAIAKLDGFDTSGIAAFPTFHKPNTDPSFGGSLCRMGFPFAQISATFDEAKGSFEMKDPPPPLFPNDGIHTRMMLQLDPATNRVVKFIETSTPGLLGQSGGPLFDRDGHVWGIQSRTSFLDLGFTPKVKDGHKDITEHQFLNVGLASHVEYAITLFQQNGVAFKSVT